MNQKSHTLLLRLSAASPKYLSSGRILWVAGDEQQNLVGAGRWGQACSLSYLCLGVMYLSDPPLCPGLVLPQKDLCQGVL